ncbi:MAG TPA: hypothetical protein VL633_07835 [Bacteroidota bacterium]|nr:hypothetical protein [Bacteroidota bacterium]
MRSIIRRNYPGLMVLLCVSGYIHYSAAQSTDSLHSEAYHAARFTASSRDTSFVLPHQFILQGSETVLLDSIRLTGESGYSLQPRSGRITLHAGTLPAWFASGSHALVVYYTSLPFTFGERYRHREPVARSDSGKPKSPAALKQTRPFIFDDLFGSNLQTNGSIVRGLTIGSNRDLTLNSGFRMQMSGNLSSDLQVIAALTDENTPLQPEGTTQTLQEVDKVFVELRGTNVGATLGDFNLSLTGSEFGGLNRKLLGGKGTGKFAGTDVNGDIMLTGATARGKFTTNQFQGIEGVEGPYRLSGQNGERTIIIIAGTERVYLNGERMTRGEINDYIIDYATGEVTFTSRRLISTSSRISVDFEYTDRQFSRNLLGGRVQTGFLNDRVQLSTAIIREGDDENSPVDASLSDSDKSVLRLAGSDRSKAIQSGATMVGPGKGQYVLRDTVVVSSAGDSVHAAYYRYAPADTANAIYSVIFSFVGEGQGDYKKITLSQYEFAGIHGGGYAPVRMLPIPQSTALYDAAISARITDGLSVTGEVAASDFDANRFSTLDDGVRNGSALKFALNYVDEHACLWGADLGAIGFNFKERFVSRTFVPLDRFNEVEFNRKWNLTDSSKADEELREGSLRYAPVSSIVVTGGLGSVKREEFFSSTRATGSLDIRPANLPSLSYDVEHISSRDVRQDNSGDWVRQKGRVEDTLGHILPWIRYEGEVLQSKSFALDTLRKESSRFNEIAPGARLVDLGKMMLTMEVGWRREDSLVHGVLQRASTVLTQQYQWQLRDWNSLSSTLDFTFRNKSSALMDEDLQTVLVRWQSHYVPFDRGVESDLFYEVSSGRSSKFERVFERVPQGSGNYVYAGDLNNNHVVDAPDFRQARFDGDFISVTVPTDQLIPVVDVKSSIRLRLNGFKISSPSNWLASALSVFSNETYARVDEQSSDPDSRQIYLLHFSRFLNDQTTIAGSNVFTNDLYLLENNSSVSCRLRYAQRNGLTQFALQNERTYSRERSVRLRWQLIREFSNQTDFIERRDNLASTLFSNRVRGVSSTAVSTDWSYRPEQAVEVGFRFGFGNSSNFDTTQASLNDQSLRLVYAITERGQARIEFSREEVTVSNASTAVPFEFTNGKVFGKSWLWHASTEYRLTKVIQASLMYDGRKEGGHDVVHTVKAEVRAFF